MSDIICFATQKLSLVNSDPLGDPVWGVIYLNDLRRPYTMLTDFVYSRAML
jgi:hypothetical protein